MVQKRNRRLEKKIAELQVKHPSYSEKKCCQVLIEESHNLSYKGVSAETLRRILQTAKRLRKDAELLPAVRDDAIATDMTNALKERPL